MNLIKEKRSGILKGRTCTDGRPQREDYTKGERSSPALSKEALLAQVMINAHEKRDVAVGDVAGAFLKAINDRFVIMHFYGDIIGIMLEAKPELVIGLTTDENGRRVLIVVLAKALYGCVRSSLLWYDLFTNVLKKIGFKLNQVEPCLANAILNGKQCTIAWYVDDSMTSHNDSTVVDMVMKRHEFLGIKIVFLDNGTAELDMSSYLRNAIIASGLNIERYAMTAAKRDLCTIDKGSPHLSVDEPERYISSVYMLMHAALRARGDLCPTLSFLSSRVAAPTKQDQQKLKRLLEFDKMRADIPSNTRKCFMQDNLLLQERKHEIF